MTTPRRYDLERDAAAEHPVDKADQRRGGKRDTRQIINHDPVAGLKLETAACEQIAQPLKL
jgi:hypothetical protein